MTVTAPISTAVASVGRDATHGPTAESYDGTLPLFFSHEFFFIFENKILSYFFIDDM